MNKDISKLIWLYFPIGVAAMAYAIRFISGDNDEYMYSELGIIENLTFASLVVAVIAGLAYLRSGASFKLMKTWMLIFIAGCIYFAGEEVSWGQHYFGWSTPESWNELNNQQETNLHNTSPLFDQIPRAILSIVALIGGVIIPLYRRSKKHVLSKDSFFDWFLPTLVCLPSAALSLLVSWHEKFYEIFGLTIPELLDIRAGEVKECMLAIYLMVYSLSIWFRNRNVNRDPGATGTGAQDEELSR